MLSLSFPDLPYASLAAMTFAFYAFASALDVSRRAAGIAAVLLAATPFVLVFWMPIDALYIIRDLAAHGVAYAWPSAIMIASLACFARGFRIVSWILAAGALQLNALALALPVIVMTLAFFYTPDRRRIEDAWRASFPYWLIAAAYTAISFPFEIHIESWQAGALPLAAAWVAAALLSDRFREILIVTFAMFGAPFLIMILTGIAKESYFPATGICLMVGVLIDDALTRVLSREA
jgi:hypothetical protein